MSIRIQDLSAKDVLAAGDQFAIASNSDGDTRRVAASVVATYVATTINVQDNKVTQYAAPSATGFTVTITQASTSVWLILAPTGTLAAGTIALPAAGFAVDRQEVLINTTQEVTALSVLATGLTVTGAPTTILANGAFRVRFDALTSTWYKVSS